jgi:hypothetical protein
VSKASRCLWSAILVLTVVSALSAARPASAAVALIDTSSCGLNGATWSGDNGYCTFDGTGENIVIGPNSCNALQSCFSLANDVHINAGGSALDAGSCNANLACDNMRDAIVSIAGNACNAQYACQNGGEHGEMSVSHNSCNSEAACQNLGDGPSGGIIGYGSIEHDSCNGQYACQNAGEDGHAVVGHDSCNVGTSSCRNLGTSAGTGTVGDVSCNAEAACQNIGSFVGTGSVGDNSCNLAFACEASTGTQTSIANYACNQSGQFDDECTGESADAGDCQYNDDLPNGCGTLQVRKFLYPSYDGGRFNLLIDGTAEAENVGQNGSTAPITVLAGTHTVAETAANTSLGNYRTTVICVANRSFAGYGFTPSLTVDVAPLSEVTCTFINQRIFSWFWWR